jgi:hypothetical protein
MSFCLSTVENVVAYARMSVFSVVSDGKNRVA